MIRRHWLRLATLTVDNCLSNVPARYALLWEVRHAPTGESPAELKQRRLRAIELLQRDIPY
jgi:hypothetical protein